MVGWVLCALVALSLVVIGTGAIVAPRASAAQYGIVLDDPRAHAFIRAMGVRDVVIGMLLALLLQAHARVVLAWAMTAIVPIAATDLLVVTWDRRATGTARHLDRPRLLHAAGAIGLLATAVVLHAGV
jgi:hypothetical protein